MQMFTAEKIRSHGAYRVMEEVGFKHAAGKPEFIDIVAAHETGTRLVIECKKLDGTFVFLVPASDRRFVDQFRGLYASSAPPGHHPARAVRHTSFSTAPETFVAKYCIGSSGSDKRPLEGIVQSLVVATETHAAEVHRGIVRELEEQKTFRGVCFIPVLVTTAKLYAVAINPLEEVDLQTGEFAPPCDRFEPVSMIRFEKDFTASEYAQVRTRTVLVVRPDALDDALRGLETASVQWSADDVVVTAPR